jgi:hypothetical protein
MVFGAEPARLRALKGRTGVERPSRAPRGGRCRFGCRQCKSARATWADVVRASCLDQATRVSERLLLARQAAARGISKVHSLGDAIP